MRHPCSCSAWLTSLVLGVCTAAAPAAEPCQSGLPPGQRPGPYSALVSTGNERGKPHCFICETGDRPAVVVFARQLTDSLGKLVRQIDRTVADHKAAELRAWVTFLSTDQAKIDAEVVKWGDKHAIRAVPLGVFEDVGGPPSYRLARDADVTVLVFVKQKVVANFAFKPGELTDDQIGEIVKAVPRVVPEKK